ncbi:hypothetical protein AHAS_Ahas06G0178500 [Arachis hypogaea]
MYHLLAGMPRLVFQVARPSSLASLLLLWKTLPAYHAMRLACHALHLPCSQSVPRLVVHVTHPDFICLQPLLWSFVPTCHAMLLKWHAHSIVGLLSLACHALILKWHAQVNSGSGVPHLRYKVACPSDDSSR